MGRLYYGNTSDAIEVDDTDLAHLRMVAMTKLRRSEGFSLTFSSPTRGRSALWVHCAIPLRFEFDAAEPIRLEPARVNELAQAAASAAGIVVELAAEAVPSDERRSAVA
ncbi:hypothetical protein [Microbacterium hominis]|uniref:DUF7882 family protein n=1 Tax=Microbacterium hominis TaxID=162426 RepID=UPI0007688CA8|nr:hypothetical protein [Microbacterium hominis]KXC05704.1 RNA polymerase subunit sigma [Microbacterium hominis]